MGDSRITTLPGLQPSARSLKDGADVRERATKRLERERKDPKGEKKSKCVYHEEIWNSQTNFAWFHSC